MNLNKGTNLFVSFVLSVVKINTPREKYHSSASFFYYQAYEETNLPNVAYNFSLN